jgi:hypothetical protein
MVDTVQQSYAGRHVWVRRQPFSIFLCADGTNRLRIPQYSADYFAVLTVLNWMAPLYLWDERLSPLWSFPRFLLLSTRLAGVPTPMPSQDT